MRLLAEPDRGQPIIVSEFGGISFAPSSSDAAWGYATASETDQFEYLLRSLFEALQSSPVLAGFCYTQLTDTLQEGNGLLDVNRQPKLPVPTIRSIVLVSTSTRARTAGATGTGGGELAGRLAGANDLRALTRQAPRTFRTWAIAHAGAFR